MYPNILLHNRFTTRSNHRKQPHADLPRKMNTRKSDGQILLRNMLFLGQAARNGLEGNENPSFLADQMSRRKL